MTVRTTQQVHKSTPQGDLIIHLFEDEATARPAPAIVFFFGGGWNGGTPKQFFPHCEYLAGRGMLAASAEYRVKSRHGTSPAECVADGKSAVRWLRQHAGELGIDPARVAAGGGSAGGHVAACTAMSAGFEERTEDLSVSSRPDALVLFNPVAAVAGERWEERCGAHAEALSPVHNVRHGLPPTIIFHGRADTTVPIADVERLRSAMEAAGNTCVLKAYDGAAHGFFNFGRDGGAAFTATVREADRFLCSLGYVGGDPTM